jgi:hypothetical protein
MNKTRSQINRENVKKKYAKIPLIRIVAYNNQATLKGRINGEEIFGIYKGKTNMEAFRKAFNSVGGRKLIVK